MKVYCFHLNSKSYAIIVADVFPLGFWSRSIAIWYASYHFQNWGIPTPLSYADHAETISFQWKQEAYPIWKLERNDSDLIWWKHSINWCYLWLCIKLGIQERGMECGEWENAVFLGMSPNILGNVAKHSGGCPQLFRGMLLNIPGNVAKYSGEYCQTFWGISSNIPGNVIKHSGEYSQTFRGMSSKIPGNVAKPSIYLFIYLIHYFESIIYT